MQTNVDVLRTGVAKRGSGKRRDQLLSDGGLRLVDMTLAEIRQSG